MPPVLELPRPPETLKWPLGEKFMLSWSTGQRIVATRDNLAHRHSGLATHQANGSRKHAFRRDGLRVFILDTVFYDVSGPQKKLRFARCFCPDRITQLTPYFSPFATVRNNSSPCGLAPWCRQAGGGEGWVGLGGVVAGGWWHGAWCMMGRHLVSISLTLIINIVLISSFLNSLSLTC